MEPVGLIGVGTMGSAMARRLLGAGWPLWVHDVRRQAGEELVAAGASWAASPAEMAGACRVVLTSLPGPQEVETVACGKDGLLSGAQPGDVHVDLTTGSFSRTRWLAEQEAAAGVTYLDAPVSGGRVGVEQGSLAVMVSGPQPALERVRPVLETFAGRIFHLGDQVGTGTLAKLINNAIVLASGLVAQEALVLAAKAGLDIERLLEVLESSSAAIYLGMARLTLARDFDDAFFTLALAEKDLSLALQSAGDLGVEMGVTSAAHTLYRRALRAGLGDKVFFATLQVVEEAAGASVLRLEPKKA